MPSINDDPRIDPRIKAAFGQMPPVPLPSFSSREELVAAMNTPEALAGMEAALGMLSEADVEAVAPTEGLTITTETFVSEPDGNTIKTLVIRPEADEPLACVYYIHGGGMALLSCFDSMYQSWGRMIAHQGVAVVMADFRNCVTPSSAPEIEPFPAGLNDCMSGLRWTISKADEFGIDADRIVVAGESGGGNLTLAVGLKLVQERATDLITGVYAMCPYIAGSWPRDELPSSIENNGLILDLHSNFGAMGYGMDAFDAQDPLAWPLFATEEDVQGFPPAVISVNECDPLRDEGVEFYRLLLRAGQTARCRQVMGTTHGGDNQVLPCPDLARATALDLAAFARGD